VQYKKDNQPIVPSFVVNGVNYRVRQIIFVW